MPSRSTPSATAASSASARSPPASSRRQIIAADLDGTGWDGLVVRNAGDGTLSLYFSNTLRGSFATEHSIPFLAPVTLDVGLGVSDVAAVTTTGRRPARPGRYQPAHGRGRRPGQRFGGVIAAPEPYRAGTGLYAVDTSGGSPVVTSLEATSAVAAGAFTPGGPTDLVTINPGTETIGVLAGLGNGRFANPVTIRTGTPPQVVRVADFTGNGIDDLAVLTAKGVSIYLGDGKGGFLPPVTYDVGTDPTGLTVADLLGNGKLDLLVGNAYGDVLILVGQRRRHVPALRAGEGGHRPGRRRPDRQRRPRLRLRRPVAQPGLGRLRLHEPERRQPRGHRRPGHRRARAGSRPAGGHERRRHPRPGRRQ